MLQINTIPKCFYPKLRVLNRLLGALKCSLLIQVQQVYNYIDSKPAEYERALHIIRPRFCLSRSPYRVLTIDCHIRRSTIPQFLPNGSTNPRFTKTSWFRNIVKEIRLATPSDFELFIRIHTDGIHGQEVWRPPKEIAEATIEYWNSLGVLNEVGDLILDSEDFTSQFQEFGLVAVIQDINPIEAWELMASSDILLIGKSSMSYLAGLIRSWRPVIFAKFWHTGLNSWLEVEENEQISVDTKLELRAIVNSTVRELSAN